MYDRKICRGQILYPAAEGAKVVRHSGDESITHFGERFCTPSGFIARVRILTERMKRLNDEGSVLDEQ